MGEAIQNLMKMTSDEFLIWREGRPGTWELWDGAPIEKFSRDPQMMGATDNHSTVSGNIHGQFYVQLRGAPCRPRNDQIAVVIDDDFSFEPDAGVDCGTSKDPSRNMQYIKPVCVVEVLSPSTEKYDRKVKLPRYTKVPSMEYVLFVRKDDCLVDFFFKTQTGIWSFEVFSDLEHDVINLESINVKLRLKDIYERIEFQE